MVPYNHGDVGPCVPGADGQCSLKMLFSLDTAESFGTSVLVVLNTDGIF